MLIQERSNPSRLAGSRTHGDSEVWSRILHKRIELSDEVAKTAFSSWTDVVSAMTNAELVRAVRRPPARNTPRRSTRACDRLILHRNETLDRVVAFLEDQSLGEEPRLAIQAMIDQTRALAAVCPCIPALDFPIGIAEILTQNAEHGHAVAVPLAIYYMGISLFDDVIDHDLDESWEGFASEQISCAALAMTSALPYLAWYRMASAKLSGALGPGVECLGQAAGAMSVGQFLDIGGIGRTNASVEQCEHIVELKTGSTGALAAKLSAISVGAPMDLVERAAMLGFNLYCAMQVLSDIQDIWSKPVSTDLVNGIITPPIGFFFETAPAKDKDDFLALFGARTEALEDHSRMRALLEGHGALRYALGRAELYRQAAAAELTKLGSGTEAPLMNYMLSAATLGDLRALHNRLDMEE